MVEKSLEQYLNEDLGSYPLIPEDEFKERLKAERQNPNKEERNELILPHMRLVKKIAADIYRKYKPRGFEVHDLVSEGYFGLERAYDKFNPEIGVKFYFYASLWIKQAIFRNVEKKGELITLPASQQRKIRHLRYHRERIKHENRRMPTEEELENATGYSKEIIKELSTYERMHAQLSLDSKVFADNEDELINQIADDKKYNSGNGNIDAILSSTDKLNEREKDILKGRYVDGKSLEEIGYEYNLTRERIRQIEEKSLAKLRTVEKKLRISYGNNESINDY